MEPLLETSILKEVFQHDTRIGNIQEYIDRISQLHHRYLKSQLLVSQAHDSFSIQELANFSEDAEFLAMEYTNPLVTKRIDGLSVENVPSRQVVQDALAVAGTIFEFLGDAVFAQENLHEADISLDQLTTENILEGAVLDEIKDLYAEVGRSELLYLKSALCYGLGMYEPRTRVILQRIQKRLDFSGLLLTKENVAQWAYYLICAFLSRDVLGIMKHSLPLRNQMGDLQESLKRAVKNDHFFDGYGRMSLHRINEINTSISIITSCLYYAEAFVRGSEELFQHAQGQLEKALVTVHNVQNYPLEWIIRTLGKVATKMWADSPWTRLGKVIPQRTYLKKLVEDGIVTLWSSQIAALEMTSHLGPLTGGYLDNRVKRVVIHMPTSAGKTFLAQLAIAHQSFLHRGTKCVYVGFSRALCDQVASDLAKRLRYFGMRVTALASDNELLADTYDNILFGQSTVVVVTPEKLSHLLRQQNNTFLQETELFIFDELHNISKQNRGWIYEELISFLLQHPDTKEKKMLFLSAVMPNHLAVQEWVDPERTCETIDHPWQPTRTLKGIVEIPFGKKPSISQKSPHEILLSGHLIYARRKEDVNSPLRIDNFITSKQIIHIQSSSPQPGKPIWKKWERDKKNSDSDIRNTAHAAIRFVRLGPVLIYCPQKTDAVKLSEYLVQILGNTNYSNFVRESDKVQYEGTLEFLQERLSHKHPLINAFKHGIAFHNADLPRDVRNEIEFAFQAGWLQIICATTTLAEGVNFPIKTLLLSHYGIPSGKEIHNPLSKSDFKNVMGRAGRALYETEGQVIFMQSVIGYPYYSETGYSDYLDLDPTSSELSIRSALSDVKVLDQLQALVDAVDSGNLTDEELLFSLSIDGKKETNIEQMVKRLQTFTLLLQEQKLVGEDEESFIRIFQATFLGKQEPDKVQRIVGPFAYHSARAIQSQIDSVERSLFAQTGLKIPTCRELLRRVKAYWEQKDKQLHDFVEKSLDEAVLYDIAKIIYSLGDDEVDPEKISIPVKAKSFNTVFDHAKFFVDWISPANILQNDTLWGNDQLRSIVQNGVSFLESKYFSFIPDSIERAQKYTHYVYNTLEFRAPWTLSAFWLFSKSYIEAQYGLDLVDTPLGRELVLLPAYAKFGVNSPAAALFSTLGISPSPLARQLADLYTKQNPEARFDYKKILQWVLETQSCDLAGNAFKASHIRRIRRVLKSLKPIEGENALQETEQAWRMTFWIAGWRHYDGDKVLQLIHKGSSLTLMHEPDNRYNPDAVKVLFNNVMLGYVPDELCEEVTKQMGIGSIAASVIRVAPSASIKKVYAYCEVKNT